MSPGWRALCWQDFRQVAGRWSILWDRSGASASQAVAGEIDAMGVVNEAVEDGVGISRVADALPARSRSTNGTPSTAYRIASQDGHCLTSETYRSGGAGGSNRRNSLREPYAHGAATVIRGVPRLCGVCGDERSRVNRYVGGRAQCVTGDPKCALLD
jgi:hypothetical protein